MQDINRRELLGAIGASGMAATAGCLGAVGDYISGSFTGEPATLNEPFPDDSWVGMLASLSSDRRKHYSIQGVRINRSVGPGPASRTFGGTNWMSVSPIDIESDDFQRLPRAVGEVIAFSTPDMSVAGAGDVNPVRELTPAEVFDHLEEGVRSEIDPPADDEEIVEYDDVPELSELFGVGYFGRLSGAESTDVITDSDTTFEAEAELSITPPTYAVGTDEEISATVVGRRFETDDESVFVLGWVEDHDEQSVDAIRQILDADEIERSEEDYTAVLELDELGSDVVMIDCDSRTDCRRRNRDHRQVVFSQDIAWVYVDIADYIEAAQAEIAEISEAIGTAKAETEAWMETSFDDSTVEDAVATIDGALDSTEPLLSELDGDLDDAAALMVELAGARRRANPESESVRNDTMDGFTSVQEKLDDVESEYSSVHDLYDEAESALDTIASEAPDGIDEASITTVEEKLAEIESYLSILEIRWQELRGLVMD